MSSKLIGFILVLLAAAGVIGGGIYYLSHHYKGQNTYGVNGSPVTSAPVSFTLNISSPDDNLLVFDPNLLIQGKTSPNAVIILSFSQSDQSITANSSGDFSTTVKLQEGINQFSLTAFDPNGNSKSETRSVFYSKDKI